MSAWLRPTWRATRWQPLLTVTASGLVVVVLCRAVNEVPPAPVVGLVVCLIVVAGLAGLHDPGRDLVHAVATPAWSRLIHRLALLGPGTVFAVAAFDLVTQALFGSPNVGPDAPQLVALGALGVAAIATLTRHVGAAATDLAAGTLGAWIAGGHVLGGAGLPDGLLQPWAQWPVVIGIAGVAVAAVATTSGVEA